MTFEYICPDEHVTTLYLSMKEEIPSKIICDTCKKEARRIWGNSIIKIPEHMRAAQSDGGFSDYDNLKSTFSHAKRPSGKEKVYY